MKIFGVKAGVLTIAAVFASTAWAATAEADVNARIEGLETYIEKTMEDWNAPSLSVAVVKGDDYTFERGFGVRSVNDASDVNEDTLFAIGSCSKAFASASVALLVSDGKLSWDDPVVKYLPQLKLSDDWVTEKLLVRDLLAHRLGTDYSTENRFRPLAKDREDFLRRFQWLEPVAPFREQYVYSNTAFIIAGELVRAVSGAESWDAFARRRLWGPLGMDNTTTVIARARAEENRAMPHRSADGELHGALTPYKWMYPDHIAVPSGGVISTAGDMAKWLRFQLNEGRVGRRRLIDRDVFQVMHTPHTPIRPQAAVSTWPKDLMLELTDMEALDSDFWSYGLGWVVMQYRGR